jgi:hypothetical protein
MTQHLLHNLKNSCRISFNNKKGREEKKRKEKKIKRLKNKRKNISTNIKVKKIKRKKEFMIHQHPKMMIK